MSVRKVLFLCAGNSCRSQIAEAVANARYPHWRAFSAGVRPSGYVHPLTLQVLREIGIEHRGESKSVESLRNEAFDLVVTVCEDAKEECPAWLGKGRSVHTSFPDPARVEGTEAERLSAFRRVRDQICESLGEVLV